MGRGEAELRRSAIGSDEPAPRAGGGSDWALDGHTREGEGPWRVCLEQLPFRIGRRAGLGLTLPFDAVSLDHAEITRAGGGLELRDLGSTNGTYVNRRRVEDVVVLADGDLLHFATFEFRLSRLGDGPAAPHERTMVLDRLTLPREIIEPARRLRELLAEGAVEALLQPIVTLPDGRVAAYEALGRGRHPKLPSGPAELLGLAASVGLARDLAALFRTASIAAAARLGGEPELFLNVHPEELGRPAFLDSLRTARRTAPRLRLTVEIHETAVTDPGAVRALRGDLAELGVKLAFDDFGAGQARLLELAEEPPDYLKFDASMVRGLDRLPGRRRQLLATLVAMTRELGVAAVAEGVETAAEAAVCIELGFTHGQGHHFGPPAPAPAGAGGGG